MLTRLFLLLIPLFCRYCDIEAGTFSIDYTNHQFLKDGQPFRYLSGSIHYLRVHQDQWVDRLQRIRALGLNAIQTYVPWNLHEPEEGTFDFSGGLNLTRFLTLAQQNDLYVLFRPGPYMCGEWEFGGFPYWLLNYDNISLRTSDPIYLNAVKNYFNILLPLIEPFLYKNGGPILMVQVENEYGNCNADGKNYMVFLRDLIQTHLGTDVALYTNENLWGAEQGCPLEGALPSLDFGVSSNQQLDQYFELLNTYNNGGPNVNTEFWLTWFTQWGDTSHSVFGIYGILNNIAHMYYNWNASINVYMIHGGTNFGFMNGLANNGITTSYDYGAAISENGDITYIYTGIRSFIENLTDWQQKPLDIPSNNTALNYGQVTLKRIGTNLISTLTTIQEPCTQSQDPINFEKLNHGYGYVLYTTTLRSGGKIFSTPNIKDYGYVFINNNYQGMLSVDKPTWLNINSQPGDILRILVENRGRLSGGTGGVPHERKGLFDGVTLDSNPLQGWIQCGINLTKASIDSLTSSFLRETVQNDKTIPEKAVSAPGVFIGQFSADDLEDTWFDSTGWGKGQLFINGYNLGRYWPLLGPQALN